jgi:Sulfatase
MKSEDTVAEPSISESDSLALFWPTTLAFLIVSSILFAWLFEWDRYHIITAYRLRSSSVLDQFLVFWVLVAKSLAWFFPMLLASGALMAFGLTRTALLLLNCFWIGIFYFMALDLVSVNNVGYHAWEYWLPVWEILAHPKDQLTRWVAQGLRAETLGVFGAFAISGPACFLWSRWATVRLARVFPHLRSARVAMSLAVFFVFAISGVVPALALFRDHNVRDRTFSSLPLPTEVREALLSLTEGLASRSGWSPTASFSSTSWAIGHPGSGQEGRQRLRLLTRLARIKPKDEMLVAKYVREAADPKPADLSAFVKKANLPNVIIIIFESFRHFAIGPELMRELDQWSKQGLRLDRHYCGSNCSHLGLFSLFYGRSPLGYYQTLDRNIPPQLLESLRRSGYWITFLTSGETKGFRSLDRFLNETYCDEIAVVGNYDPENIEEQANTDRGKLARMRSIVSTPRGRPQCVFFYLLSSHWPYSFPPEFQRFKDVAGFWQFLSPWEQIQGHLNRYANSLSFLDREVMQVLGSIDMKQNIVVITGDHGESMGEDGIFRHSTRMSEIQMRTPCVMVGAGIAPRGVPTATVHSDILPTLLHALAHRNVPIENCQGRDLLADQSPADEVGTAPANGPRWEGLLVVQGKKRMAFSTDTFSQTPSFEFAGLVDRTGQYKFEVRVPDRVRQVLRIKR